MAVNHYLANFLVAAGATLEMILSRHVNRQGPICVGLSLLRIGMRTQTRRHSSMGRREERTKRCGRRFSRLATASSSLFVSPPDGVEYSGYDPCVAAAATPHQDATLHERERSACELPSMRVSACLVRLNGKLCLFFSRRCIVIIALLLRPQRQHPRETAFYLGPEPTALIGIARGAPWQCFVPERALCYFSTFTLYTGGSLQ